MEKLTADIVVIGGGIAGLWTLAELRLAGYEAVLFEKDKLGCMQTLASQGMIHGGQRYFLQGNANAHGESLSAMPKIWDQAFSGAGKLNLSGTKILSDDQFMWSPGGLAANVTSFFASKTMNAKMKHLDAEDLPEVFKNQKKFKGLVYRMSEVVIDTQSLMEAFRSQFGEYIFSGEVVGLSHENQRIDSIQVNLSNEVIRVEAKQYIFAAGRGNEFAVEALGLNHDGPKTQRRPLKQVLIKGRKERFYGHCITVDPRPRMTISAHHSKGEDYWYLGGIVAEYGIDKDDQKALSHAKKELHVLFPWLQWEHTSLATMFIDRAEPYAKVGFFKEGPQFLKQSNALIVWPTKLTFAPSVAKIAGEWVVENRASSPALVASSEMFAKLPKAQVADYPWDHLEYFPWESL